MRALTALPLDDDLIDRIFTFCPEFATLHSLILVSKAFRRSITRAVAYNIVGPALPQALRVIRYPYHTADGGDRQQDDPGVLATECPEDHDASVISPDEKKSLERNSKTIEALEDIFSLTQKDRTSRTSVLTTDESWRFRRAAYRIMLYCNIFPASHGDDLDEDSIRHVQRQRTAVLQEYPTDELLQLYAVFRFFRGILEDACDEDADNQSSIVNVLLTMGPDGVKHVWDERTYHSLADEIDFDWDEDLDYPLYRGYFSLPLDNIWTARKVKPPKDEEPASKFILDTIIGANDTCSQCAAPGGLSLLTEANWRRAPLYPGHLLKGKLQQTVTIQKSLFDMLHAHSRDNHDSSDSDSRYYFTDENCGPWIASVFDVSKPTEWDGWTKDKSYCLTCLTNFLEEHLWRWLLQEQIKGGWSPPQNCWYGYNCRTMVHNQTHANKLNHLCVPTRGDP
ncbi:hypothetical protein MSAN_02283700 [Mycena sanguinolenta]|uniref:F-box domain-containing protein n=1 Tax=Mycena sanguinolenta TaxID=230812 RepID=A0A8H6X9F6_9AGAR|nr:hypothetical protein MSAN_02283700 [Mycena sanguinolenta]